MDHKHIQPEAIEIGDLIKRNPKPQTLAQETIEKRQISLALRCPRQSIVIVLDGGGDEFETHNFSLMSPANV